MQKQTEGDILRIAVKAAKFKQEDFAELMGFSRNYLLRLMERAILPSDIIESASVHLLTKGVDLKALLDPKPDKNQTKPNPNDTAENKSNAVHIVDYEHNIMLVPLVPVYAQAGYQSGYADPEYMKTLPTEPFPVDREYKGTYICFEVKGDSLDDDTKRSICAGDKVLGRELSRDRWRDKLHIHKYLFVIVTKNEGIVIKQITKHDTVNGIITVHSYNTLYDDYEIKLDDVAQLFNVVAYKREM